MDIAEQIASEHSDPDARMVLWGKNMKNSYMISRIVICVMTGVISIIAYHNEHISMLLGGTIQNMVVALVISFLTTPVSKRMIALGDRIRNMFLRVCYYVILLPIILVVVYLLWILILNFYDHMEHPTEWGSALSQAFIVLYLEYVVFMMFIVPYIQSLIVLMLRGKRKDNHTMS